jgi:predicted nucleic acid-binding protein
VSACVIDSSAWVSTLLPSDGRGVRVRELLADFDEWWIPEAFDLEVLYAMRGHMLRQTISLGDLLGIGQALMRFPFQRVSTTTLNQRIVSLATTISTYDAAFVAVAELLGAPLMTTDVRLSRATGPRCEFLLVEAN